MGPQHQVIRQTFGNMAYKYSSWIPDDKSEQNKAKFEMMLKNCSNIVSHNLERLKLNRPKSQKDNTKSHLGEGIINAESNQYADANDRRPKPIQAAWSDKNEDGFDDNEKDLKFGELRRRTR